MIGLSPGEFLTKVYLRVLVVTMVAVTVPLLVSGWLSDTFAGFCVSVAVCVLSAALSILFIGCAAEERRMIMSMIFARKGK